MRVGLLEKAPDVRVGVDLDEAVRAGIVDRRQHDGRSGLALAVQRDDRLQIDFGQDVAVEDDDGISKRVGGKANRAGGAEGRRLHHVAEREAAVAAVAEDFLDAAGLIVEAEDDLVDLRHLLDEIELKLQERPIEDRNDGLRGVNGEGAQPRALAPGEQNRLHADRR